MELNNQIEYSLLHANVSNEELKTHIAKAVEKGYHAICIPPSAVQKAKEYLGEAQVKIVAVCDYPFGYAHTASKVEDAKRSLEAGADEIDLVPNFSAIQNEDWKTVENDIQSVATICQMQDKGVKVIVESSILPESKLKRLLSIAEEAKVNFVKTGTGLLGKPVSESEIKELKNRTKLPIKAAGGIRSKVKANKLLEAGASRIGTSKAI